MTNVRGRDYGTHAAGANGRTLCKRYDMAAVNVATEWHNTSCRACLRCVAHGYVADVLGGALSSGDVAQWCEARGLGPEAEGAIEVALRSLVERHGQRGVNPPVTREWHDDRRGARREGGGHD